MSLVATFGQVLGSEICKCIKGNLLLGIFTIHYDLCSNITFTCFLCFPIIVAISLLLLSCVFIYLPICHVGYGEET